MGLDQVCNTISKIFSGIRPPAQLFPGILLLCSLVKRPGLSAIQSTSNVAVALSKLGIPTGAMPDGSPNLTIAFTYALFKENFRAIKFDAMGQTNVDPITGNGFTEVR